MLNHILNNRENRRVAVIVNDMSEVNIDASLINNQMSLNRAEEKLVEMSNGCICCTLREDLLVEVTRLAKEGKYDYLVIESTGISEPLPVAETFTFEDDSGASLSQYARLDTMVTVVDAVNFLDNYYEAQSLQQAGEHLGEEDQRTVTDLLVDQIEFCDLLLVSKCDLVEAAHIAELKAVLRSLNSRAEIITMEQGRVDLSQVLGTGKFNMLEAQKAPGWLKELRGEYVPETEEYGISSFTYRARRPFHPQKLYDFFIDQPSQGKLLRSKGFFWLASRPQFAGQWSQAGGIAQHGAAGLFWKAVPEEHWPADSEQRAYIRQAWQEPFGDMRQELVFIGQGLNPEAFKASLDQCLLTDEELLAGKDLWHQLPDPFPEWSIAGVE